MMNYIFLLVHKQLRNNERTGLVDPNNYLKVEKEEFQFQLCHFDRRRNERP